MNPFITQIVLSLFYLAVFIVACSVITTSIRNIIHEYYAAKTTMLTLTSDEQARDEQVKRMNARVAQALANER